MIIYIASFFNQKAGLFRKAEKTSSVYRGTRVDGKQKHIWFHFASLGEFEQEELFRTAEEKLSG
ncbi:hypothetical protein CS542_10520 [Pedobacter sp. IW39]|nr:hypothetical protein CS542_10520 [Pedobacter sp. IW39]